MKLEVGLPTVAIICLANVLKELFGWAGGLGWSHIPKSPEIRLGLLCLVCWRLKNSKPDGAPGVLDKCLYLSLPLLL